MKATFHHNLRIISKNLSKRKKLQLILLLILMIISSLMEGVSISSVMIYITVLTNPELVFNNPNFQNLFTLVNIESAESIILPFSILFLSVICIAVFIRYLLLWAQTKIAYSIHNLFSVKMFLSTLYQPYSVHILRNSSEVITGVERSLMILNGFITPCMNIISGALSIFFISITLLFINPKVALAALIWFGGLYFVISLFVKKRLNYYSIISNKYSIDKLKILQEGLGGIRDILINNSQSIYADVFEKCQKKINSASSGSLIISQSPRLIMEFLGILFICFISFLLVKPGSGLQNAMAILGSLVLSAQRLLPALQSFYNNWASIISSSDSVNKGLYILNQSVPLRTHEGTALPVKFQKHIKLENLSFSYEKDGKAILKNINLVLEKGKKYGFIGRTGSGKSTLLDIVMGLLPPTKGILKIDDMVVSMENLRSWQSMISHVPQSIFLSDATIEENIAFGVKPGMIDFNKVKYAAEIAQISSTIEGLPNKYKTIVGERGIRLSGGQRQRIGIARALYKDAQLIIFDEATSALDSETEFAVIESLKKLSSDITILIIAHRITTLDNCDKIFVLNNGNIVQK